MSATTEMEHPLEILHTGFVTHDVQQFLVTRPEGFEWEPGQGVKLAVAEGEWEDEGRPFTPTSLEDAPVLEFTIKEYPSRDGVTEKLHTLEPGETVRISEAFGTLTWQGPGTFLAAGAGITPFLAMLRQIDDPAVLERCSLHFSNKTPADVICEKELRHLLGDRCHFTCTHDSAPGYDRRRIDQSYLEEEVRDFSGRFYLCGPPDFVKDLRAALVQLGATAEQIVVEE